MRRPTGTCHGTCWPDAVKNAFVRLCLAWRLICRTPVALSVFLLFFCRSFSCRVVFVTLSVVKLFFCRSVSCRVVFVTLSVVKLFFCRSVSCIVVFSVGTPHRRTCASPLVVPVSVACHTPVAHLSRIGHTFVTRPSSHLSHCQVIAVSVTTNEGSQLKAQITQLKVGGCGWLVGYGWVGGLLCLLLALLLVVCAPLILSYPPPPQPLASDLHSDRHSLLCCRRRRLSACSSELPV